MPTTITDKTLNNIVDEIKGLADVHEMLFSRHYGNFLDVFQSVSVEYSTLLINVNNATIDEHYFTYRLELGVFDKTFKDDSNLDDVLSDTISILADFYSVMTWDETWQDFAKITQIGTMRKFINRFEDVTAGWGMELQVQVQRKNGICDLPFSTFPAPPGTVCKVATYRNSDDTFVQEIASGGDFTAPDISVTINGDDAGTHPANKDLALIYVCPPGTPVDSSFNGVPTTTDTPAGETLAIGVFNSAPLIVGTLVTDLANVKAITIADSIVKFNDVLTATGYLSEALGLNIRVVNESGDPVGTLIGDSNITKTIEVPDAPAIYYNRPWLTQAVSYRDYDEKWRVDNPLDVNAGGGNSYNESIPANAIRQEKDFSDGVVDKLKYFNIWGHKFQFTGLTGGYCDPADDLFYDVDGVLSDKATEFPPYSGDKAIVQCHLTGFQIPSNRQGTSTWLVYIDETPTENDNGQTDWFAPSFDEANLMLTDSDLFRALNLGGAEPRRGQFNYSQPTLQTGTTSSTNTAQYTRYLASSQGGSKSAGTKTATGANKLWFRIGLTGTIPQP